MDTIKRLEEFIINLNVENVDLTNKQEIELKNILESARQEGFNEGVETGERDHD